MFGRVGRLSLLYLLCVRIDGLKAGSQYDAMRPWWGETSPTFDARIDLNSILRWINIVNQPLAYLGVDGLTLTVCV